ncbi:hypothetical protein IWX90DRAFT_411672 [Phyllosticta citrichinensis]|uniref:BTB domain-containing protein n=1 Tax=Phyllosticta citrichinensis TaxID=1130410 RepID=A0ABR1Y1Y2_9PEZI
MGSTAATTSHTTDSKMEAPSQLISVADGPVTLQVCTRRFVTTRDTLCSGSTYFSALLSSRWAHNAQPDGSFFVDADPDLFEHILRFLRRGVYPIFHDTKKGHDHSLYAALQKEADFFGIDDLSKWLEEKKFMKVVKVKASVQKVTVNSLRQTFTGSDEEIEVKTLPWARDEYICLHGAYCPTGDRCALVEDPRRELVRNAGTTTLVHGKKLTLYTKACLSWEEK